MVVPPVNSCPRPKRMRHRMRLREQNYVIVRMPDTSARSLWKLRLVMRSIPLRHQMRRRPRPQGDVSVAEGRQCKDARIMRKTRRAFLDEPAQSFGLAAARERTTTCNGARWSGAEPR